MRQLNKLLQKVLLYVHVEIKQGITCWHPISGTDQRYRKQQLIKVKINQCVKEGHLQKISPHPHTQNTSHI